MSNFESPKERGSDNKGLTNEARKREFREGQLNGDFFNCFGAPDAVEFEFGEVKLKYHKLGEKNVSIEDFYDSAHWEAKLTQEITVSDSDYFKSKTIMVKIIFPGIVGGEAKLDVCQSDGKFVSLTKVFDSLDVKTQTIVLSSAKEWAKDPEKIAADDWKSFIEDKKTEAKIDKEREVLINLLNPGEPFLEHYTNTNTYTSRNTNGDDEEESGTKTTWFLVTGAHAGEKPSWEKEPIYFGGVKTKLGAPTVGESAEGIEHYEFEGKGKIAGEFPKDVQNHEVDKRRKAIHGFLFFQDNIKVPKLDPRVYDITDTEWMRRYNKVLEPLQEALKAEWDAQEQKELGIINKEWNDYESVANRLKLLKDSIDEIQVRSKRMYIEIPVFDGSILKSRIGADPAEKLGADIVIASAYLKKAEQLIARQLDARGAVEIAPEDIDKIISETPSAPAQWYLRGIDSQKINYPGINEGEGFGKQIAGTNKYLPGKREVLGFLFEPENIDSRIEFSGIEPMIGHTLPSRIYYRDSTEVLGLINDPDNWYMRWTKDRDNDVFECGLVNKNGVSRYNLKPVWNSTEAVYSSEGWRGVKGNGPSWEELRQAFPYLSLPRKIKELNPELGETPEKSMNLKFSYEGKRYFKCGGCERMDKLSKADDTSYNSGQEVKLTCSGCQGEGVIQKE